MDTKTAVERLISLAEQAISEGELARAVIILREASTHGHASGPQSERINQAWLLLKQAVDKLDAETTTVERLISLAELAISKGDVKRAHTILGEALRHDPKNERARLLFQLAVEKVDHELEALFRPELPEHEEPGSHSNRRAIPDAVKIFVWRRDGGRCVKCGSQKDLEFDHIIPLNKGGSNTARNIQLLCEKCNRSKGGNLV